MNPPYGPVNRAPVGGADLSIGAGTCSSEISDTNNFREVGNGEARLGRLSGAGRADVVDRGSG